MKAINLLLDTTQPALMFALTHQGEVIYSNQSSHHSFRHHASVLIPQIQDALNQCGLSPNAIHGVGVNMGPGSFTGIRTGLSVARLMGQFFNAKTYGFNTFELLAAQPQFQGKRIALYLNAFRQQHYYSILSVGPSAEIVWEVSPQVSPNDTPQRGDADIYLMEGSLTEKLELNRDDVRVLEEIAGFTPEAIQFYLIHAPERYCLPWEQLVPLYLQLPHITQPKARAKVP